MLFRWGLFAVVVLIIIIAVQSKMERNPGGPQPIIYPKDYKPSPIPPDYKPSPIIQDKEVPPDPDLRWQYDEHPDKMGRGTVKTARVFSLNEIKFGFPYGGTQRAELSLRIHPKYGKDVILSLVKGQFLCGLYNCRVDVRFDGGKVQKYTAVGPADHSSTLLFIRDYGKFLASARKAKKVYIEAQFYQEGTRVFEFDISDLKW